MYQELCPNYEQLIEKKLKAVSAIFHMFEPWGIKPACGENWFGKYGLRVVNHKEMFVDDVMMTVRKLHPRKMVVEIIAMV